MTIGTIYFANIFLWHHVFSQTRRGIDSLNTSQYGAASWQFRSPSRWNFFNLSKSYALWSKIIDMERLVGNSWCAVCDEQSDHSRKSRICVHKTVRFSTLQTSRFGPQIWTLGRWVKWRWLGDRARTCRDGIKHSKCHMSLFVMKIDGQYFLRCICC